MNSPQECNHKWKIKEENIMINKTILFRRKFKEKVITLQCKRCGYIINRFIPLGDLK